MWETLIFGTGDWFAFGEPFFCGLFTPTYPLPGHRLVPESHIRKMSFALLTTDNHIKSALPSYKPILRLWLSGVRRAKKIVRM